MLDDLHIGDADILNHQEGRSAHHGWHNLPVDRGGYFDSTRLFGGKTDAFHHRYGEGARSYHVGN